ncbi:MAG: FadR/GntR family transcriptional regulator [Desulfosarcinaceae bacterium]|nr:FadR/GntR family transcriptional regulator [Desulfosarcinaceae bacterium]
MPPKAYHRKLYEYIMEEIALRILKGDYPSETTLPNEDALCKEYQVSRGVLREATKVLTQKGLIQARPKVGTLVQPRSNWNLFDADVLTWKLQVDGKVEFLRKVTEVRRLIESEAARCAAERCSPTEIAAIAEPLEEMAEMLTAATDGSRFDYETYLAVDMAFHMAIMEASHNELLAQIGVTMRQAVLSARRLDIHNVKVLQESVKDHRRLFTAIQAGDAQGAYDASRLLFDAVWRHLPQR